MAYLNFNKIVPPAPNDPLVDEATQINANWDHIEAKLTPYMKGGTMTNVETGQEHFNGSFEFCVRGTSTLITPKNISEGWSAWTNFPIAVARALRTDYTPKWRNNPLYRMVECTGGFQYDAAASAWPMGSFFLLNADAAGSPPASMQPIGNIHYNPCAVSLNTGTSTSVAQGGLIKVEQPVGSTYVRLSVQYMGGAGGGNFVMIDQVWWWY